MLSPRLYRRKTLMVGCTQNELCYNACAFDSLRILFFSVLRHRYTALCCISLFINYSITVNYCLIATFTTVSFALNCLKKISTQYLRQVDRQIDFSFLFVAVVVTSTSEFMQTTLETHFPTISLYLRLTQSTFSSRYRLALHLFPGAAHSIRGGTIMVHRDRYTGR